MPTKGGPAPQPRSRVSALDRALQVLDQLQATGAPMTAYDIARTAGAPLSTMYSIIDDLVERGLLMRADDRRVWLGPRLYGYGLLYASSLDLLAVAGEEMQRLSREVEETVQICGRDEGMMVVLLMAEGPGHFRVTSRVGSRVPSNWTASGRLLVGHLPPAKRAAYFAKHAKASPTGRAETDARKLAQASAAALEQRLSMQVGESDASVACLAAPVVNERGECQITISIVLPEAKAAQHERYARAVQAAAERIEQRLGWRTVAEPRAA
ncbi:IclR family transcriptional regulator [Aquincola sp. S2]|uniref:IclR family transcriptional regulator n=1 Tax=Pseudaquabacterium terrae TaxID=2732868 RepID=A0ABX2EG81_9BURK|nr:IclR family transcriptional regulator [Aquabacterium terrae]NRF67650.1 IclR family transcriptional regulator [Aquabacterium terrae]